jgi:hypothetical protein
MGIAARHEEEDMYAYNLFRSTQPDGLVCAVPEERSVPPFVTGPHWQFGGRISDKETPLGFDRKAAKTGVRFNGFYLFASFQKDRAGR